MDVTTGNEIARNDLAGYGQHEIRLAITDDGSTLIAGSNGYVFGLVASEINQALLWATGLRGSGYEVVNVLTAGNSVYVGSNGYVYALNPTSGKELHRFDLPDMGHNEVRLSTTLAKDVMPGASTQSL